MKKHRPRPKKQHPKSQHQRAAERSERQEAVEHLIAEHDAYAIAGEYEKALEAIDPAQKLAPFDPRIVRRRIGPLFCLGRFDDTLVAIERSIAAYRLRGRGDVLIRSTHASGAPCCRRQNAGLCSFE